MNENENEKKKILNTFDNKKQQQVPTMLKVLPQHVARLLVSVSEQVQHTRLLDLGNNNNRSLTQKKLFQNKFKFRVKLDDNNPLWVHCNIMFKHVFIAQFVAF